MDRSTASYVWSVIERYLLLKDRGELPGVQDVDMPDLPRPIGDALDAFLTLPSDESVLDLALVLARRFELSSYLPNEHVLLVSLLAESKRISVSEACNLLLVDGSSVGLLRRQERRLFEIAAAVREEDDLGMRKVDSDSLLIDEITDLLNRVRTGVTVSGSNGTDLSANA